MPQLYEVLRPFDGGGESLQPGAVVDVTAWRQRNVEGLVNNRYLKPVAMGEPAGFNVKLERQTATSRPPVKIVLSRKEL